MTHRRGTPGKRYTGKRFERTDRSREERGRTSRYRPGTRLRGPRVTDLGTHDRTRARADGGPGHHVDRPPRGVGRPNAMSGCPERRGGAVVSHGDRTPMPYSADEPGTERGSGSHGTGTGAQRHRLVRCRRARVAASGETADVSESTGGTRRRLAGSRHEIGAAPSGAAPIPTAVASPTGEAVPVSVSGCARRRSLPPPRACRPRHSRS
ncbi:hypothetical protein SAMN04487819_101472 [Actinopolyspora alba]|uniref:Uncharacterized protein n=1 Tax=Actinopolyspora alba TaxID=673379 RepID=A0A1I1U7D6_9ACTN|nr:hypothetical protein SAMN04487819_101472 [Actinopolyspora alba]